jgi:hypothetical protein
VSRLFGRARSVRGGGCGSFVVLQWVPHQGVVLRVQLGGQASVRPDGAWCGRATTRKDSISSSTSPPWWESCRIRVAWDRDRASRGGPLLEAADLAVA